MSVKNTHADYSAMKAEWEKCINFMKSEKAIKDKNETYLPRLAKQDDDEYTAYRDRTPITMYAQRANKAMCGMIGRKEPRIDGSESNEDLIESIDSKGNNINAYISLLLGYFFTTGRGATLIDVPRVQGQITVAQAEQLGIRPRFYYYSELNIINWRTELINNVETLVLVVLKEKVNELTDDEFTWEQKDQYRVLELVGDETRVYRQRLYNHDEELIDEVTPRMQGRFMDFIPIVFHGGVDVIEPPLNQVVDLNVHHYQLSADEVWGLRVAALPTPYFFGVDPTSKEFPNHVGPGRVIGAEEKDCKTGFREFSGAGLKSVADKLDRMAQDIEKMSIQMATETFNQTATGSSIDYTSSTSSLAGITVFLSAELTQALKIAVQWQGRDDKDIDVQLNKDFMPQTMDSNTMGALLKLYLSGTITYETLYNNLARGEITDPHKDPEEELREIEEGLPPGMINQPADDFDEGDDNQGEE